MANLQDKMIKTREQWYPCYPRKRVRVLLAKMMAGDFRVSAWGADDFGYELESLTQEAAEEMFDRIQDYTTIAQLKEWGFVCG